MGPPHPERRLRLAAAADRRRRHARPRARTTRAAGSIRSRRSRATRCRGCWSMPIASGRGSTRWFQAADLIVCPAMPQPAIRHGESTAAWFGDTYSDVHNLTGWPAVVVRGGTSAEGLPIGVQLVARAWREDVALAARTGRRGGLGRVAAPADLSHVRQACAGRRPWARCSRSRWRAGSRRPIPCRTVPAATPRSSPLQPTGSRGYRLCRQTRGLRLPVPTPWRPGACCRLVTSDTAASRRS